MESVVPIRPLVLILLSQASVQNGRSCFHLKSALYLDVPLASTEMAPNANANPAIPVVKNVWALRVSNALDVIRARC